MKRTQGEGARVGKAVCVFMFPVSGGVDTLFITACDFSVKRITPLANKNLLSNLKLTPPFPEWWGRWKLFQVSRGECSRQIPR